ncbi:1,2-phenylacetyl-CoA epoxidase subunit PaaC [Cognaticolwellia beringensis]|uniref:Phenylacetate-CoA oxygenase subunit PaaI n=1 Tax=Cognaticolwellia beringensis TaxID=1967665 RepID=A0A222GE91_9GAMM|nr:1,2-phenylacetyl-CoA epoxidase subunit PaaC [Cognaticolwellia beringensis]ASP49983.1 phenylacetate-CoA oxygenase subunit PaaI [Cognaticolwellia beringensis]
MAELKDKIQQYATRLGDDSLVLGHRISEWTSHGPFLEEDIALGNVALDYVGRARMFYSYAAELAGEGKTEDDFAYLRDEREFQNYLINELPRGDFAFTIVRQLFVDVYFNYYLTELKKSKDPELAAIATKSLKETRYHLRRSRDWTIRLGIGTEESKTRMTKALNDLWGYTHELFEPDELEIELIELGIAVDMRELKANWLSDIKAIVKEAELEIPDAEWAVRGGREGFHTEHLSMLLTIMQSVHRANPGANW